MPGPSAPAETCPDDGLLVGLKTAPEKALQHPEDDQLCQVRGNAAEKGAYGERGDANDEVALAPDEAAEKRRNGEHDAVRDEIGVSAQVASS